MFNLSEDNRNSNSGNCEKSVMKEGLKQIYISSGKIEDAWKVNRKSSEPEGELTTIELSIGARKFKYE